MAKCQRQQTAAKSNTVIHTHIQKLNPFIAISNKNKAVVHSMEVQQVTKTGLGKFNSVLTIVFFFNWQSNYEERRVRTSVIQKVNFLLNRIVGTDV